MTVMDDLTGRRFGRLLVLGIGPRVQGRKLAWHCLCDCGAERLAVVGYNLRAGLSKSCGCLSVEIRKAAAVRANRTHGRTHSPIWTVWYSMRQRCRDPKHKSFAHYGARGISVCDRWEDFENFLADMGERPPGMQIDRIDNERGYEPGNCRWTTCKVQNRNRRSNRPISALGETKLIVEWAEDPRCAVSHQTLAKRLESGWAAERAITRPLRGSHA